MNPRAPRFLAAAAFALLLTALPVLAADTATQDVTSRFSDVSPAIEQLRAVDVGGILILRGRTADQAQANAIGQRAVQLGYSRVANLIQVVEPADDAAIERTVERQLALQSSLKGCHITVDSNNGIVFIAGEVQHELQKDVAIQLVRNIDGVKSVRSDLRRF